MKNMLLSAVIYSFLLFGCGHDQSNESLSIGNDPSRIRDRLPCFLAHQLTIQASLIAQSISSGLSPSKYHVAEFQMNMLRVEHLLNSDMSDYARLALTDAKTKAVSILMDQPQLRVSAFEQGYLDLTRYETVLPRRFDVRGGLDKIVEEFEATNSKR